MPETFENTKPEVDEETIRKLSRVTLKAAERGRLDLFDKLTEKSAQKIRELSNEKPVFYDNNPEYPRYIALDSSIADNMPDDFFDDPTGWIESQKDIQRSYEQGLPEGDTIQELRDKPYDISKVKEFKVNISDSTKIGIVSKRVDIERIDEVDLSKEAFEKGIPTPKVLGEVYDKGNVYVFWEKLNAKNINEVNSRLGSRLATYQQWIRIYSERGDFESFVMSQAKSEQDAEAVLDLREEKRKSTRKLNIVDTLLTLLYDAWGSEGNKYKIPDMDALWKDKRFEELNNPLWSDLAEEVVKNTGAGSVEDFFESAFRERDNKNGKDLQDKEKSLDKVKSHIWDVEFIEQEKRFEEKIKQIYFGFNLTEQIDVLKKACDDKGIEHKDFADRNILIPWNFENDIPLSPQEDRPKLYIIDWEKEKSKKQQ